jgi:hypothetical protein
MSGVFRSKGRSPANMGRVVLRSRGRRRGLGSSTSRAAGSALSHPPQIRPAIAASKTFRFAVTGSPVAQSVITQTELANLLVVATSSTATSRVFSSVRLRKVEAWALPVQGNQPQSVSISGIGAGPENRKSDQSMGITPAHVRWNPAPNSVADLWFEVGGSLNMFEITAPTAAVVDVSIDFIQNCADTATAGPTSVGATAGVWYGVPLDGLGNFVLPVDYVLLP